MARREKTIAILGIVVLVFVAGLIVAGNILGRRIEPYIKQQAEQYLRDRFRADVQIAALRVRLPTLSPVRMVFTRGRGNFARVEGDGIVMRIRGREGMPPFFSIKKFTTSVDIGSLFDTPKHVALVTIQGLEINIPPKGERPKFGSGTQPDNETQAEEKAKSSVVIDRVDVDQAALVMMPKDRSKKPLRFDIHTVRLQSAGPGVAMKYDAVLTNAKPPGEIHSVGSFGPWNSGEPGDTPLSGDYTFDRADLGVFAGIAGTLHSKGQFEGTMDYINARGEATVPDFRLKRAGNAVPLHTRFEVLVDGTNGNTTLKPVVALLGSSRFTTSGVVFKRESDKHRSIVLDVDMPEAHMPDILRLAMKGAPFMEGRLKMKTKLEIPPLDGRVKDKLRLDGRFEITGGRFLKSTIQDQIDSLSRRGQGQPKNEGIDEVFSRMQGAFRLDNGTINFRDLTFGVPGADVQLAGTYDLEADELDFKGALKLQAKVSETMTGWKRWLLKPVDPFLAKNGVGTYLKIQVAGSSDSPKFGLAH
jgi:hypothetical protein